MVDIRSQQTNKRPISILSSIFQPELVFAHFESSGFAAQHEDHLKILRFFGIRKDSYSHTFSNVSGKVDLFLLSPKFGFWDRNRVKSDAVFALSDKNYFYFDI